LWTVFPLQWSVHKVHTPGEIQEWRVHIPMSVWRQRDWYNCVHLLSMSQTDL